MPLLAVGAILVIAALLASGGRGSSTGAQPQPLPPPLPPLPSPIPGPGVPGLATTAASGTILQQGHSYLLTVAPLDVTPTNAVRSKAWAQIAAAGFIPTSPPMTTTMDPTQPGYGTFTQGTAYVGPSGADAKTQIEHAVSNLLGFLAGSSVQLLDIQDTTPPGGVT